MSFNDLERGEGPGPNGGRGSPSHGGPSSHVLDEDHGFSKLKDSVSIQIFKIQSNVQGIQRLVDKLGTGSDNAALRTSLVNLTDATREMIKRSTGDVKNLASVTAVPPNVTGGGGSSLETTMAQRKAIQNKISKDFTNALTAFQKVQRLSAERQRHFVEDQKREVQKMEDQMENEGDQDEHGQLLQMGQIQQQEQHHQVAPQEVAFQESMIAEREGEIREIESGIHELNEIFRDLGTIVVEQGGMLDNIESNVTSIATNTRSAAEELTTAHEYQRKKGRRMLCLALILVIVTSFVLLAILS